MIATIFVALTLTSCGTIPQVEIDSAKAAVEALKVQQADIYVGPEFAAVQDSLNVALENVEVVSAKFLFRNYDAPKAQLEAVIATAATLSETVVTVKAQVKAETEAALAAATLLLEENTKLVARAPRGKEGRAALEAIKSELAVLSTSLTETGTLLGAGSYMAEKDKVTAASQRLTAINTELKDVIAKVRR